MANASSERLAAWFDTPQGVRLLREERAYLGEAARRFHGDTLLWAGCHGEVSRTVRGCMIRHRLFASPVPQPALEDLSSLRCDVDALPLPNGSLDAMVLHHALETAGDPRGALREAARVLVPGGRLVICAFNPLSLWGGRRLYARVRADAFTGLKFVTAFRLLDWLALLGFERQSGARYLSYGLPFQAGAGEQDDAEAGRFERFMRRAQMPCGGVYLVSVVKQAAAVRPNWRPAGLKGGKLLPAAYPKSAVQRSAEPDSGTWRAPVLKFSDWKDLERGG